VRRKGAATVDFSDLLIFSRRTTADRCVKLGGHRKPLIKGWGVWVFPRVDGGGVVAARRGAAFRRARRRRSQKPSSRLRLSHCIHTPHAPAAQQRPFDRQRPQSRVVPPYRSQNHTPPGGRTPQNDDDAAARRAAGGLAPARQHVGPCRGLRVRRARRRALVQRRCRC
jgi:hypothetical protein